MTMPALAGASMHCLASKHQELAGNPIACWQLWPRPSKQLCCHMCNRCSV